jgi:hypothetical protein
LETAKGFAAFRQWLVAPGEPGDDRAVGVWKRRFPGGLDRYVVAENGADIVETSFFVGHGNQSPVAVSGTNFAAEDWRLLFAGLAGRRGKGGSYTGQRRGSDGGLLELDVTPAIARAAADNCFCRWTRALQVMSVGAAT